ncbi:PAS domain S-box protein [Ponticoccus sp. SC2-23]|uniref:ATP-binding protein n=1 Tax=Alexandriicola marinus TaxID=2081710 RepID=UPI000FDB9A0B|nr:ATP-binding protein [Alexandriicola marinus]MBM1220234.1 PAS domain S-box protein [Ponticoccus sp. SC6-9]MBM1224920.1 PAS domain S-box protein [Ponticoccus sp. SC6-15]MBM1228434.1 PAS domain S-box protein [Ponticoccus sp. SC6-38]MBM1233929.1 PAS domain S-box protein [Ponticoccus sp. SC6-45]MBM1238935.1 PAS domain S-box protein [Ponticoccus sp. SC6-49]MBM1242717.1 PAS domain S-box protein [Ponticoccus sp. SC2-64]MBM1247453.1 PAS domain S-box protein [Ponticoccus sp. SC6-42]MBM1251888.1 PA
MLDRFIANFDAIRRLMAFLAVMMILAIIYFADDVREQLSLLATASSDNVQWTLSQAEVEAKALETEAAVQHLAEEPDLSEVRIRFDILYSRVATLKESAVYASLRVDPRVESSTERLDAFFERTIPIIDGPDADLREFLPELAISANQAHADLRQFAIAGIEIFSRLSDDRRRSVSGTLIDIALLSAMLFLAFILLIYLLLSVLERMEVTANNLRLTKDRMQTIVDNSLDAIVVTDLEGRIVEFNRAAERIFGYSQETALGRPMGELIVPEHLRDMHERGMARYLEGGERHVIGKGIVQLDALRASGEVFPVDIALAAAESSDDHLIIGFMRDISKRLKAETELREARDRAIAGEKSKAELLAVMSHEMRTPLNGMLGTLELIDADGLDDATQHYLEIIRKSGNMLLGHVNDVLEISRLDADKLRIDARRFDLVALLREVIDSQDARARENGNVITLTPPDSSLHHVWGDEGRIRQIMVNLVGNAVKFTANGTITLEAECHDGLDDVEIRVIDSGIGIQEEDIDRIFQDFVTIDASYGRSSGGTGLGLGISQRLARALGGELGAESEPGDGSVFWLRLPLAPDSATQLSTNAAEHVEPEAAPAAPALPPLRVLLIEDNPINRLVAREMLERDGHSVVEAHDGREGVAAAHDGQFDLILMDISMPGLDGLEATEMIRADPAINSDIPIIATTAHALPDEIRRFRDAGMTDILVKPLRRQELRRILGAATRTHDGITDLGDAADQADQAMLELLDMEQVMALSSTLRPERYAAVLRDFHTEARAFQASLANLPAGGADPERIANEAHRMAGSAAVFGTRRLNDLLVQIEDAARARDPLDRFGKDLEQCWSETEAALARAGALQETGSADA